MGTKFNIFRHFKSIKDTVESKVIERAESTTAENNMAESTVTKNTVTETQTSEMQTSEKLSTYEETERSYMKLYNMMKYWNLNSFLGFGFVRFSNLYQEENLAIDSQLSKMQSENPPSYEETTQSSKAIEKIFISQLEKAPDYKGLLHVLLSDNGLSPDYKCKAMEKADKIRAIDHEKNTILLEDALWLQGSHKLAQSVSYYYNIAHGSSDKNWCKALIEADIEETPLGVDRQYEDSQGKEHISTGIFLQNYAKIARGEEVAVGGPADVAKDHERSLGLTWKGCITEATVLQHAPVV
ncbi:hypothetical protein PENVUL_c010G09929 [Penicillium vulpinum]|uniref:Uncharacterized protein n=2 Tax=Penicillium vulpinum TaxID=29845 RepID=A0A1V6S2E0_9EURO|nr:hypothetical protein PENVUL_c010G09929 [Penicillium vulpinum]